MARSSWCVNPWMSISHLSSFVRFWEHSTFPVFRFQVWTVGPAGSRHRGSRQSLELCQQHMVSGIPAPWTKMVKCPKVQTRNLSELKKALWFFFCLICFWTYFSMSSDIRHKHQMYSWHRLHAPRRALRSCPAPLCWLWPWKSRPNSWARRSSNYRSFKSLLPKIFRWSI